MEANGILIATSSTVIGIILGAFISSIGYFIRVRKDRARLLNECLFNLLEIWHLLITSLPPEPNIFLKKIIEGISKRIPQFPELSDDDKNQITTMINRILPSIFSMIDSGEKSHEFLKRRYSEIIVSLSREDPFLAYKISSHADFGVRLAELKLYIDNINAHLKKNITNEAEAKFIDQIISSQYLDAKKSLLADIEQDMIIVSSTISIRLHKKTLRTISSEHSKDNEIIDQLVDTVLTKLFAEANNLEVPVK